MSTFSSAAGVGAALAHRRTRKKMLKDISRTNELNRGIERIGAVSCDDIASRVRARATMIVSGGERRVRNALIASRCAQCNSQGLPTVVLHEGNVELERELAAFGPHVIVANAANPFYEPFYSARSVEECARLVIEASSQIRSMSAEGGLYVRALATILQRRSVRPYARMLASCPHDQVQHIIADMEASGQLGASEAVALRNDAGVDASTLGALRLFFDELASEGDILAWRSHLLHSASARDCVSRGGMLVLDATAFSRTALMAMVAADLGLGFKRGAEAHVVIDGASIAANKGLIEVLDNASACFWTLSSSDLQGMLGPEQDLERWLAKSDLSVLFSHGARTAESISKALGEYDKLELTQSCGSNTGFGQFGFHVGTNDGSSIASTRDSIVRAEVMRGMPRGAFMLIENGMRTLSEGSLA